MSWLGVSRLIRFTDREFEQLKQYVGKNYGIDLTKKRVLAESRMNRELEQNGFSSMGEYLTQMEQDKSGRLRRILLNRLTTNYTYFMREQKHFEYLANQILPEIKPGWGRTCYRVWSAGCSSGQECYTLAMMLQDYTDHGGWLPAFEIFGTDISDTAIKKAMEGRYPMGELEKIPPLWQQKYCRNDGDKNYFTIAPQIRQKVRFQVMNLLRPTAGVGYYDLILCRNVMIYFDEASRKKLIDRLYAALKPDGYLFVGHTELLPRHHELFEYVCPAIYRK